MPSRADGQLLVRWIEIKGGLLIETWILLSSSPCWYNRRQIHQLVWRVSWPCAWIVLDPGSQRCQSWNCSWQLLRIHKSSKEGIAKQFKQLKACSAEGTLSFCLKASSSSELAVFMVCCTNTSKFTTKNSVKNNENDTNRYKTDMA